MGALRSLTLQPIRQPAGQHSALNLGSGEATAAAVRGVRGERSAVG